MWRRGGARGGARGPLTVTRISVGVKTGKLSGPPAGMMVLTRFPGAVLPVFLWIQSVCVCVPGVGGLLSCGNWQRASRAGKPLHQPAAQTPSHRSLHNQTDSAADHTLSAFHAGPPLLPPPAPAQPTITLLEHTHRHTKNHFLSPPVLPENTFSPSDQTCLKSAADKRNEIQNLRAIWGGRGAAICNHL